MVAIDLGDSPTRLVGHARGWAEQLGGRLHLRAVSAAPSDADRTDLAAAASGIPEALAGTHEVLAGSPIPVLVEAAAHFDLTVVGTHGRRHLARLTEGSVAAQVARLVRGPVLVLPEDHEPRGLGAPLRVLVALAQLDLAFVKGVLRWFPPAVDLHLAHVEDDAGLVGGRRGGPAEWPDASAWEARLAEAGIQATLHGVTALGAAPAPEIATMAGDVDPDVLVVRTHGRTGLARLVQGSVSERVLRLVDRPVLVLT